MVSAKDNNNSNKKNSKTKMNKKQILQVTLAGIIGFVIYVAVSILSGEIERWKKLIIFSVTYAILLPLVRYIKKYRKRK